MLVLEKPLRWLLLCGGDGLTVCKISSVLRDTGIDELCLKVVGIGELCLKINMNFQ